MMKNGVYDKEMYSIGRLFSLLNYLKSNIKIEPSKTVYQIIIEGLNFERNKEIREKQELGEEQGEEKKNTQEVTENNEKEGKREVEVYAQTEIKVEDDQENRKEEEGNIKDIEVVNTGINRFYT